MAYHSLFQSIPTLKGDKKQTLNLEWPNGVLPCLQHLHSPAGFSPEEENKSTTTPTQEHATSLHAVSSEGQQHVNNAYKQSCLCEVMSYVRSPAKPLTGIQNGQTDNFRTVRLSSSCSVKRVETSDLQTLHYTQ